MSLMEKGCGLDGDLDLDYRLRMVCIRLRAERERQHLSQMELAKKSGVSQNMITYIETGKRGFTVFTLFRLCDGLGINPAALFDDQNERQKARDAIIHLAQYI